jgi:hypothetical protein
MYSLPRIENEGDSSKIFQISSQRLRVCFPLLKEITDFSILRAIPLQSIQQRDDLGGIISCSHSRDGLSIAVEWEKGEVEVWSISGCKQFSSPPLLEVDQRERTEFEKNGFSPSSIGWNVTGSSLYHCRTSGRSGVRCTFPYTSLFLHRI